MLSKGEREHNPEPSTVAGLRTSAVGYAAPGLKPALGVLEQCTSKPVLRTCLEETLGGRTPPPQRLRKSDFFRRPLRTPIFSQNVRKWVAHWTPKSSKILPNPYKAPSGASRWRRGGDFLRKAVIFTKHQYLLCLRHILPAQGAPLPAPLGPKAVQRALQCRF